MTFKYSKVFVQFICGLDLISVLNFYTETNSLRMSEL